MGSAKRAQAGRRCVVLEKELQWYPRVFPLPLVGSWQGLDKFSKIRKALSTWLDNLNKEHIESGRTLRPGLTKHAFAHCMVQSTPRHVVSWCFPEVLLI